MPKTPCTVLYIVLQENTEQKCVRLNVNCVTKCSWIYFGFCATLFSQHWQKGERERVEKEKKKTDLFICALKCWLSLGGRIRFHCMNNCHANWQDSAEFVLQWNWNFCCCHSSEQAHTKKKKNRKNCGVPALKRERAVPGGEHLHVLSSTSTVMRISLSVFADSSMSKTHSFSLRVLLCNIVFSLHPTSVNNIIFDTVSYYRLLYTLKYCEMVCCLDVSKYPFWIFSLFQVFCDDMQHSEDTLDRNVYSGVDRNQRSESEISDSSRT